jgi:phosphoenolpyruvate carboxykinase (GTP)
VVPLVHEAFDWDHGVYMGATAASEATAAALDVKGHPPRPVRHAALLRLPHGRLLAALVQHGRQAGRQGPEDLLRQLVPQVPDGKWLWPGFGENSRVLKWMCERRAAFRDEVPDIEAHFKQFGDRLPARLSAQLKSLVERLG